MQAQGLDRYDVGPFAAVVLALEPAATGRPGVVALRGVDIAAMAHDPGRYVVGIKALLADMGPPHAHMTGRRPARRPGKVRKHAADGVFERHAG